MKNHFFVLLLTSLFFTFSCNSFLKKDILIDNPSGEELSVSIDGKNYIVTPFTSTKVKLAKGEYQIIANQNGEEIFNEKVNITDNGVLNTTKSTYVIWTDLYLPEEGGGTEYIETELENVDTEINGNIYESVMFEVFEGTPFIKETWDYGLETYWPEKLDITIEKFAKKSKIYRLSEIENEWGFYGDYDLSNVSDEEFEVFMDSLANEIKLEDSLVE